MIGSQAVGWAAISACTTGTGQTLTVVNTGPGCTVTDELYNNFSAPTSGVTAGDIFIQGVNAATYGATTITPVQIDFSTTGTNTWTAAHGTTLPATAFNYKVGVDTAVTGYTAPHSPDSSWDITEVLAGMTASTFHGTSSATLIENFCANGGTLGANGGAITGCATSVTGQIKIVETTGGFADTCTFGGTTITCGGGNTSATPFITLASPVSFLTVQESIGIINNNGSAGITVSPILNEFDETGETPEPSTFALLGSALAGVATLHFRRRKLKS